MNQSALMYKKKLSLSLGVAVYEPQSSTEYGRALMSSGLLCSVAFRFTTQ
jgi:hypothetical protein